MNIVTGKTGKPHVTSQQQRDIYSAIFGNENNVLNIGKCLKAELQPSNTVRVYDGVLVMQGCVASIDNDAYDDVKIANGAQGEKRIDLIVAKYQKDAVTGYESVSLEVIKGESGAKPKEPTIPYGNIRKESNEAYFSLYSVSLNGINIEKIEPKFEVLKTKMQNPKILWQGAYYMRSDQDIILNDDRALSKQSNGFVFVWCEYDQSSHNPKDTAWTYFFVPKNHVLFERIGGKSTTGIYMTDAYAGMYKYLYVDDTTIKGYTSNIGEGSFNGVTYNNDKYILRYVIGV